MRKLLSSPKTTSFIFFLFILIGFLSRVWQLGTIPGDINQDEAFGAYEAYSLLHYGTDSHGYHFPVYLTTWGSGMSALNSYLMMPFIALFGLKTWVIRIPQLLIAVLTLWSVYLLVNRLINKTAALCALFLLAISPWHIFMSRWSLDCNLAPGFLIFGLYFFVRGLENARFFLLSALMYGLSLYCYATIWPFVPLMLLLQLGYCFYYKKIRFSATLLFSGIILGILALPLLLFLLVNYGIIEEIRLPFFSVPKLLYMRSGEINFNNLYPNLKRLWHIIKLQIDYMPWNSTEEFGIYYYCTLPFFFLGLFFYITKIVIAFCKKEFCPLTMIFIQLGCAGLLGLLIFVNINRVNILFIPMIIIASTGIYYLCRLVSPYLLVIPFALYTIQFVQFEYYYFTEYQTVISQPFCEGIGDAINAAMSHEGTICISPGAGYTRVLFYSQEPVTEYLETVQYINYPSDFLYAKSFGRFLFEFDAASPDPTMTYVLDKSVDLAVFSDAGFQLQTYGNFTVAYKP